MKTQGIIFDMDGVIIDSEHIWHKVDTEFLHQFGGTLTNELHEKMMGSTAEHVSTMMKNLFDIDMPIEKIIETRLSRVYELCHKELELIPGFQKLISEIQKLPVRIGLASGGTNELIDLVLDKFDLRDIFEFTLSADDVPHPKPAPDVYTQCAKELGIDPQFCIAIEDAPQGITSAKAAGMKCIATPNPALVGFSDFSHADIIRENLTDILIEDLHI